MVYARRVRSLLKGGVDIELGEKTCVVGRNGAGKTAISQALKLGLLGYVDDQEGKDGVSNTASIARLFPPGCSDLVAEVEMSDGSIFRWSSQRKAKEGFTRPSLTAPYAVRFPFLGLKALMAGDQRAVRAWLEERAGGQLSEAELLDMLPPAQRKDAQSILQHVIERAPVELAAKLKAQAAALRREATQRENTVDSIVAGVSVPLDPTAVAQLKQEQDGLMRQLAAGGLSRQQYDALRATMDALAEELVALQEMMSGLPEVGAEQRELMRIARAARDLTRLHVQSVGDGLCFVCRRGDAHVADSLRFWEAQVARLESAGQRAVLQAEFDAKRGQLQQVIAQIKAASITDTSAISQRVAVIQGQLAADGVGRRAWQQAEGVRRMVHSNRALADTCAALARTWADEGQRRLERRKAAYETGVSSFLPNGERVSIDLDAGRVGLLRNNQVYTSLSGAELARVLMAVVAHETASDSTPTIIEPEDRGWDPVTLASVMAALTPCNAQVLLMSTTLPEGAAQGGIQGWKIITL